MAEPRPAHPEPATVPFHHRDRQRWHVETWRAPLSGTSWRLGIRAPPAPARTPGSQIHGGPAPCCLDRRRQRVDVVGALMPTAVDEEGRGATDGGDVGALDVPVDPS